MKLKSTKILFIAGFCALALAFPLCAFAAPVATVEQIQGEVSVHTAGAAADAWTPITQNTPVNSGDSVKTAAGTCALVYTDQATFNLEANTSLTVQEQAGTQDISLLLGRVNGKVDHTKVTKPFQVVTPTAVAAVRGTDVSFDFNDQGQLTIDLHNGGPLQVYNDQAEMNIDLDTKEGPKKITVAYDPKTGIMTIKNNCDSKGNVVCAMLGKEFSVKPCDEEVINPETAGGENTPPDVPPGDDPEIPDEHSDVQ